MSGRRNLICDTEKSVAYVQKLETYSEILLTWVLAAKRKAKDMDGDTAEEDDTVSTPSKKPGKRKRE